jgi:hypothetical protein
MEPEPEVPNPYLGKWQNEEYKFFNTYSLDNNAPSNKIDSSNSGKYKYTYNFISNTALELNYGDTQKVTQPFNIINDKTISIRAITGVNTEYNVIRVNATELILENQEPSFVSASTKYISKKREIWKKLP